MLHILYVTYITVYIFLLNKQFISRIRLCFLSNFCTKPKIVSVLLARVECHSFSSVFWIQLYMYVNNNIARSVF